MLVGESWAKLNLKNKVKASATWLRGPLPHLAPKQRATMLSKPRSESQEMNPVFSLYYVSQETCK